MANSIFHVKPKPKNTHKEVVDGLSRMDRTALFISDVVGTFGCFLIIVGWSASWVGWNLFAPPAYVLDTAPAFVIWLLVSNFIQLTLMPLLMVAGNIQNKHNEARAEHEYHLSIHNGKDIDSILAKLDKLLETK